MSFIENLTADDLVGLLEGHCSELSEELGVAVFINYVTLYEIEKRCKSTVNLFDKNADEINHYKEAAIFAYWIRKLKPMRIESPRSLIDGIKAFGESVDDIFYGQVVHLEEQKRDAISFPVNEYVSMQVAADFIYQCQLDAGKHLSDNLGRANPDYVAQLDKNMEQFQLTIEKFQWPLRYYNYSPISISHMLETAFNTTYG